MARYVQEVRALGGVPVLLTPLTRRSFRERGCTTTCAPWADATADRRARARALLDLNAESYMPPCRPWASRKPTRWRWRRRQPQAAERAAGWPPQGRTRRRAKRAFDRTHVGAKGAAYFRPHGEREMVRAVPARPPVQAGKRQAP
jgi:hypothetical protein